MDPLTWATGVPKEWSEFKEACSEDAPCPGTQTCVSERTIYVADGEYDTEWLVEHGCYNESHNCETGYAETELDDNENDGSFSYWEKQCDLDFPTEAYTASSDAMKGASVAMLASLIAFSMNLF